jgi:hypothetical protein
VSEPTSRVAGRTPAWLYLLKRGSMSVWVTYSEARS